MDNEKSVWVRMSWELAALEALAAGILADPEYHELMGKDLRGVTDAMNGAFRVRSIADTKSGRLFAFDMGGKAFIGTAVDPANKRLKDFRHDLRRDAQAHWENMRRRNGRG